MGFEEICSIAFSICVWLLRISVAAVIIYFGVWLIGHGVVWAAIIVFLCALTFILYWINYFFMDIDDE